MSSQNQGFSLASCQVISRLIVAIRNAFSHWDHQLLFPCCLPYFLILFCVFLGKASIGGTIHRHLIYMKTRDFYLSKTSTLHASVDYKT